MAELSQMPLEILEDIVRRAVSSGVSGMASQLASVNSIWQSIVEKTTFEELRLRVEDVAPMMEHLRSRPERFNLVRRIIFTVVLPVYSAADSASDRFGNDLVFSKSITTLLSHLGEWQSTGRTLELQLYIYSPADERFLLGDQWFRYLFGVVPGDLLHNRTYGSTLELYGNLKKKVPAVTKLTLRDDCERYIAASGIQCLFHVFSGLRDVDIRLWDFYKHTPDSVRRSTRRSMASALDQMASSIGSMRFHVKYYPPADQRYKGEKLYNSDVESDPLTVAYRNATQKMTIVDVHGMLGTPELFWPKEVNEANPAPFWPNLKYMELHYHILDPAGEWFFVPDAYGNRRVQAELPLHDLPMVFTPREDMNPLQNRYTADQDKMDDFYIVVAKAVTNMPKLQHLRLQALMYWNGQIVPFHVFTFTTDERVSRAVWSGSPPFEPSIDVLKAWRAMAYERGLYLSFESTRTE
ncbi:hypothetical protein F5Y14DRAFT_465898 [Nemania sp. NC0429]|nr:hypothetical protein F5Y14DRAFT_465898 [Nemania sp. NC0429]